MNTIHSSCAVLIWAIAVFCCPWVLRAQPDVVVADSVLLATGLPLVEIESVGHEMPTCDYVTHPEGAMGESITNATKVPGRLTIRRGDTLVYDSGPYAKGQSGMTFKIHGNTSAYQEQKPYKVKLQSAADLLQRQDDMRYADKNWLLITSGPWIDMMVGFRLSQLMRLEWTPAMQYVNLVVNGSYRGVYALVEQVEYNEKCRIAVDKHTGFIIERDPYWWNEPLYFITNGKKEYTFKHPDEDDVTPAQVDYIRTYVEEMERAIDGGTYEAFIDVASWATWLLTHDILGTWDSGGSNIYLAKHDSGDAPLRMVCIWDFGSMTRMRDAWARIHADRFFYFPQLLNNRNTAFLQAYLSKWSEVCPAVFDEMDAYLDSLYYSDFGESMRRLKEINGRAFGYEGTTLEQDIDGYREWFSSRRVWLASQIDELKTPVDGVNSVAGRPGRSSGGAGWYDVSGRRVCGPLRGMVIGDGGLRLVRPGR